MSQTTHRSQRSHQGPGWTKAPPSSQCHGWGGSERLQSCGPKCLVRRLPLPTAALLLTLLLQVHIGAENTAIVGFSELGRSEYPGSQFRVVGEILLDEDEGLPYAPVLDTASGHVLFGLSGTPPRVAKFSYGNGGNPPRRLATLELEELQWAFGFHSTYDPETSIAYYAPVNPRSVVAAIASGDGEGPPKLLGVWTAENEGLQLGALFFDGVRGYLYYLANSITGTGQALMKLQPGNHRTLPAQASKLSLQPEGKQWNLLGVASDAGYLYLWAEDRYGHHDRDDSVVVVKIALPEGYDPPVQVASLTLPEPGLRLRHQHLYPSGRHMWLLAEIPESKGEAMILKLALGDGDEDMEVVDSTVWDAGSEYLGLGLFGFVVHPGRTLYLSSGGSETLVRVYKFNLPGDNAPPVLMETVVISEPGFQPTSALSDPEGRYALFGITSRTKYLDTDIEGRIVKVELGNPLPPGIRGNAVQITDKATVTSMAFHSHAAVGQLRFAIYDNEGPRNLLWCSGPLENTSAEETLSVAISEGSPSELTLEPGDYWLTWQSDTREPVASHTPGSHGDGFFLAQPFGEEPEAIRRRDMFPTADRWTLYIIHEPVAPDGVD